MSEFRRFLFFLPEKGKTRFAGLSLFLSGESPRVDRLQSWNHVEFSKIKLRERQPIAWRLFAMYILLGNRNPNPVFDVRIGLQFLSVGRNASSLHGFDCLMNGVGECPNILKDGVPFPIWFSGGMLSNFFFDRSLCFFHVQVLLNDFIENLKAFFRCSQPE